MAHDQEVVSSNPSTVYWMDVSDACFYVKNKMEIKVAKYATPKKKNTTTTKKLTKNIHLFYAC